jgi:hypothetical protein
MQRGSEQVLTVSIDAPASVTRLVIGTWLNANITVLVIDPEDKAGEVRTLSRWSIGDIARFSGAKRLTYVGDYAGAENLLRGHMEISESKSFEQRELVQRETDLGQFFGSVEERISPDGRQLRMFRGLERETLESVRQGVFGSRFARIKIAEEAGSVVETFSENGSATVRSISYDGSMFEVHII